MRCDLQDAVDRGVADGLTRLHMGSAKFVDDTCA